MYIRITITILITCSILLLGACQSKSNQMSNQISKDNYDHLDVGPSLWETSYDNSKLDESVKQQIRRWVVTESEIPYYIHSRLYGENADVVGLFRTADDWEIRGTTEENQTFILKSSEDKISLVYDEYEEELAKAEVDMLIPLNHLYIIEKLLEANKYEWIIWREEDQHWSIQLKSSSDFLYSDFEDYIGSHFTEERSIDDESLEEYFIMYDLQLYFENDQYTIKSLHFSLEKRDILLEEIQFYF